MTLQNLTDNFAIPGALEFSETDTGLLRAHITTPSCTAELYLQGAHLTAWQPTGEKPVIFLSERSPFAEGKAIRGGVPIIFPWFGARLSTPESPRTDGPAHGFARASEWTLAFAALAGDDMHLTLTLGPSDTSRALGWDHFQLAFELKLGRELRMRLTVANQSTAPMRFEEALHTYFTVSDATTIAINGLANTEYLDKTDSFKRKTQLEPTLHITKETDRLYLNTTETVTLDDPGFHRRITVAKSNSNSSVVWNPWSTLAAKMADMTPENWRSMTCIETVNAMENNIQLAPTQTHTMEAHITVDPLAS
ncbi:D-hexose-6-phosphate mutarotase [Granulicella sp. 5B5]|uniref:D-hexose-6-phosphate mutarotase n=1 Tax=Granulicella sp. 5B5 TaxID=1617967 RepID=UPI0015F39BE6|nr:D-hexose-6-phosphate mutarotase [Granulicella sp. 5B5]QMV18821.1 D-hexose-6-phosphate mutarotase [Granulicella sp. 5B5]